MKFVVAGGGVAGLAASLAVARAGHDAVVLERDPVQPGGSPHSAFDLERRGIPHYFQPHRSSRRAAPAGGLRAGRPRDAHGRRGRSARLGAEAPGARASLVMKISSIYGCGDRSSSGRSGERPAEPAVEIRAGVRVTGLVAQENGARRAAGVAVDGSDPVRGDVVVDALGRYRPTRLAAGGGRTDRFGSHLLLPLSACLGFEHLDAPI